MGIIDGIGHTHTFHLSGWIEQGIAGPVVKAY